MISIRLTFFFWYNFSQGSTCVTMFRKLTHFMVAYLDFHTRFSTTWSNQLARCAPLRLVLVEFWANAIFAGLLSSTLTTYPCLCTVPTVATFWILDTPFLFHTSFLFRTHFFTFSAKYGTEHTSSEKSHCLHVLVKNCPRLVSVDD